MDGDRPEARDGRKSNIPLFVPLFTVRAIIRAIVRGTSLPRCAFVEVLDEGQARSRSRLKVIRSRLKVSCP